MSRHQIFAQKEIVLDSEEINLFGQDSSSFTFNGSPVTTNGVTSVGAVGSSPNANAATITSGVLHLQPASDTQPGVLSTAAQKIAGEKEFVNDVYLDSTLVLPSSVGTPAFNIKRGNNTGGGQEIWYRQTDATTVALGELSLPLANANTRNFAFGQNAGTLITTGADNFLGGDHAGNAIVATASRNTMVGSQAGSATTLTNDNTCVGYLTAATSGRSNNIVIGSGSGSSLGATSDNNILISNVGAAESGAIRIGHAADHTTCFIAGISGVTSAGAVAAVINASGQLGTIVSSQRYKEDIQDLSLSEAELLYELQPKKFRRIGDSTREIHRGVIAEEAEKWQRDLIVYNSDGQVEAFQYEKLHANYICLLKQHRSEIELEKQRVRDLRAEFETFKKLMLAD